MNWVQSSEFKTKTRKKLNVLETKQNEKKVKWVFDKKGKWIEMNTKKTKKEEKKTTRQYKRSVCIGNNILSDERYDVIENHIYSFTSIVELNYKEKSTFSIERGVD